MATILRKGLIHVRKTITFDGGAGSGAAGDVLAFECTGAVVLAGIVVRITTQLTQDDPSIVYLTAESSNSPFSNVFQGDSAPELSGEFNDGIWAAEDLVLRVEEFNP